MKNVLIAAAAVAALATPAYADTLQAEVRLGDVRNGTSTDNTEYRVQWDAGLAYGFTYGAELQVKQGENEGHLGSKVSAKLGYELPEVLGFHALAYTEAGKNLDEGNNFVFWGAGAKASRKVYGPISLNVGYRHRQAFNDIDRLKEDRVNAGLGYALTEKDTIGVNYYRTTGSTRNDQIGVGVTHRF